jgi:hypothetical protein
MIALSSLEIINGMGRVVMISREERAVMVYGM